MIKFSNGHHSKNYYQAAANHGYIQPNEFARDPNDRKHRMSHDHRRFKGKNKHRNQVITKTKYF